MLYCKRFIVNFIKYEILTIMKSFTQMMFKRNVYIILLFAAAFSACKKTETDTSISYLRVINASPALATYNVYFSGSILNSAALPFAGSVSYGSHAPGSYSLKFTTASNVESLLTKTVSLSQGTYQSFYLINKPGQLDGLTIGDDLSVPSADKAYIRFINLSPDAPALDLLKTGATSSLTTNKAYKAASGFIAIDAGTVSLDVKDSSTGAIKTTLSSSFVAGLHYDVICGGLISPANDTERPLSLRSILIK